MSQSSCRTTHSRRTRQASSTDTAVTEASFQGLALSPSPSHHSYPAPLSPYQATDQQYRHAPYNRNASSTTYLQAGCNSTTLSGTPSNSFAIASRRDQQPTIRSPGYLNSGISSQAQAMPAPDMSTFYMQPTLAGGASAPSYGASGYYPSHGSSNRSMSTSFPPRYPSHSGASPHVEESEFARQRRRMSQETRRQSKLRVRKNTLPGIRDAGLDSLHATDSSVDSSFAASSTSTYVNEPNYINTFNVRGGYNDVVSGNTYNSRPHDLQYPMSSNLHTNTYPSLPPTYIDPRKPGSMSAPMHPEPVPISDRREKPRCYDHGCNGREFSTFSNLLRHQREKSGTAAKSHCPNCGAEFTRTTARNGHMEHGKCKPRRPSDA